MVEAVKPVLEKELVVGCAKGVSVPELQGIQLLYLYRHCSAEGLALCFQLTTPGTARVKGAISARNVSPATVRMEYAPCIDPTDVRSGQKLVYSKTDPGRSSGCSPTTPGPSTRSSLPSESVMIHSRLMSCAVSLPTFEFGRGRRRKSNSRAARSAPGCTRSRPRCGCRVVVSLMQILYRCPSTRCGMYGSSRNAISSARQRRLHRRDRLLELRQLRRADDRRGDARPGSTHASATCARLTPRRFASLARRGRRS